MTTQYINQKKRIADRLIQAIEHARSLKTSIDKQKFIFGMLMEYGISDTRIEEIIVKFEEQRYIDIDGNHLFPVEPNNDVSQ